MPFWKKGREAERKNGWIVRETREHLKQERLRELSWGRRINGVLGIFVAALFALLLLVVSALTQWWSPTLLPMLAPKDPQSVLGLAWQVHAGITAIAFAGLALLFQFST